jgi:membrane-associated HD superfamily phosphohydrolase
MNFLAELKKRNSLLYWFGLFNLIVAIVCLVLMQFETRQILGVNMWLKPFKFYASVGIMVLTMAGCCITSTMQKP